MTDARRLAGPALSEALRNSRARTLAWSFDLDDAQWAVPQGPGVNPLAWELAHVAWFAEFWILRGPHRLGEDGRVHAARPAQRAGPDELLDSSRLAHAERWAVALPSRTEVDGMLARQLDAVLEALGRVDGDDDAALYFHRLALFHEDMHGEALAWTRATLGLPAPAGVELPQLVAHAPVTLPAGEAAIGWPAVRPGFSFDNEREGHLVELAAFEIDATPVSAGAFLRFVEAGGYDHPAYWPGQAGAWRAQAGRTHPARWRRTAAGAWEVRWFDRWRPLDPNQAVIHITAWEAEAWCHWAGRRLPSPAEWEQAAAQAADRFAWGHGVWEWTSDAFLTYTGFVPGPYRDYSAPWFGSHRELRGGAFATHTRLHDLRYRNFFEPGRCDVFAGFRSAASQS